MILDNIYPSNKLHHFMNNSGIFSQLLALHDWVHYESAALFIWLCCIWGLVKWSDLSNKLSLSGISKAWCVSGWYRFVSDVLWNAVVCFQPPNLLIGKVGVAVMNFCACPIHCKVHWRVGRRLGSCILISAEPLIGSTIAELSISSILWVLEVLCLYWHRFYQILIVFNKECVCTRI